MRFRRVAAGAVLAAVAGTSALLISTQGSSAATPAPTQINLGLLNALGMSSAACPLPLNGSMAITPGTTVQFEPDALLSALQNENVSITPNPDPKVPTPLKINGLTSKNGVVKFATGGTYKLDWQLVTLGVLGLNQTGKIVVDANAQKCVVAVSVPTPSVSVPGAGPVNSIVNGVVGGVVGGVNSVAAPINSAVGPVLGGVNGGVGSITGGGSKTGGSGGSSNTGPTLGTIYTPSSLTPAQRRVPTGGDAGGGGGGASSQDGSSLTAADLGFKGLGSGSAVPGSKSGGSPKTVELAADKPRSALDGWANLIVLVAVLALSGATAFYARTYLLHPLPAKVGTRS